MKKILILVMSLVLSLGVINQVSAKTDEFITVNVYASFDPDGEAIRTSKIGLDRKGYLSDSFDFAKSSLADKTDKPYPVFKNFVFTGNYATEKPDERDILKNRYRVDADATMLNGVKYQDGEVIDLYAIYEREYCTITWLDYEDNVVFEQQLMYGREKDIDGKIPNIGKVPSESEFQRFGYTFEGFDHDEDAYVYPLEDATIRPIYTPKEYTITFLDIDGNVYEETVYKFNEEVIYPETAPLVEGMVFLRWDSEVEFARGDKRIKPVYTKVDLEDIDITHNFVVDDTYFTDGISNAKFKDVIDNAKLADLKYGDSTLLLRLSKDKEYTIQDKYMHELAKYNISMVIEYDDLRARVEDLTSLDGEVKVISKNYDAFTKSIVNGEYTYKPVAKPFSLSVYVNDVLASDITYYLNENYSTSNFVVVMEEDTPINIIQWTDKAFELDDENEYKFITERTIVVDGNSDNGGFNSVVDFIKNIPTTTLVIAGLSSLVVVLGIGILFSRKK